MRKKLIVGLVPAALAAVAGCDSALAAPDWRRACTEYGLCDAPDKPALHFDVACDATLGSTCTRDSLATTLDAVVERVADRPGSTVRLWSVAADIGRTEVLGEQTIPRNEKRTERSARAELARIASAARDALLGAARRALGAEPARRSPLFESVAKIALAGGAGARRTIVVVTDAREVSALADFECRPIPRERDFAARLERRGLFAPGSLARVRVSLAFVKAAPVEKRGCPVRVDREVRAAALWRSAVERAGGSFASSSALPDLGALPTDEPSGDEQ